MGAFDVYEGAAPCPMCGATNWIDGQTKFFDPDFGGVYYRHFEAGLRHPLEGSVDAVLADALSVDWFQVSAHPIVDGLDLLADDFLSCSCQSLLAPVLGFAFHRERPPSSIAVSSQFRTVVCPADALGGVIELVGLRLIDVANDDAATTVDVAEVQGIRVTSSGDWQREHDELASMAVEERIAFVGAYLQRLAP